MTNPQATELADKLWCNFLNSKELEEAVQPDPRYPDYDLLRLHQVSCEKFCNYLLDEELTAPYAKNYPEHDKVISSTGFDAIPKEIWKVSQGVHAICRTEKLRIRFSFELLEDLRAFHGIDAIQDMADINACFAATELQMKLRKAAEAGAPYKSVFLYLPPFLGSLCALDKEDFVLKRKCFVSYALIG